MVAVTMKMNGPLFLVRMILSLIQLTPILRTEEIYMLLQDHVSAETVHWHRFDMSKAEVSNITYDPQATFLDTRFKITILSTLLPQTLVVDRHHSGQVHQIRHGELSMKQFVHPLTPPICRQLVMSTTMEHSLRHVNKG